MQDEVKSAWNACADAYDLYATSESSFSRMVERPAVLALTGDLEGLKLLDLGCGSGVYSVPFAAAGATVAGMDLSETMIELARKRASALTPGSSIEFRTGDISERLPFPDETFDRVLTSTALHYLNDLSSLMKEVSRVLKRGGRLVASVLHPINTSRFPIASQSADRGGAVPGWETRSDWQVNYFGGRIREIETPWLDCSNVSAEGRRLRCYHPSVSDYLNAVKSAGLVLSEVREPSPPEQLKEKDPNRYEEASALPLYLIFAAVRP